MVPDIKDPWLIKLLTWADSFRTLGVWANADYPRDARRALEYAAQNHKRLFNSAAPGDAAAIPGDEEAGE